MKLTTPLLIVFLLMVWSSAQALTMEEKMAIIRQQEVSRREEVRSIPEPVRQDRKKLTSSREESPKLQIQPAPKAPITQKKSDLPQEERLSANTQLQSIESAVLPAGELQVDAVVCTEIEAEAIVVRGAPEKNRGRLCFKILEMPGQETPGKNGVVAVALQTSGYLYQSSKPLRATARSAGILSFARGEEAIDNVTGIAYDAYQIEGMNSRGEGWLGWLDVENAAEFSSRSLYLSSFNIYSAQKEKGLLQRGRFQYQMWPGKAAWLPIEDPRLVDLNSPPLSETKLLLDKAEAQYLGQVRLFKEKAAEVDGNGAPTLDALIALYTIEKRGQSPTADELNKLRQHAQQASANLRAESFRKDNPVQEERNELGLKTISTMVAEKAYELGRPLSQNEEKMVLAAYEELAASAQAERKEKEDDLKRSPVTLAGKSLHGLSREDFDVLITDNGYEFESIDLGKGMTLYKGTSFAPETTAAKAYFTNQGKVGFVSFEGEKTMSNNKRPRVKEVYGKILAPFEDLGKPTGQHLSDGEYIAYLARDNAMVFAACVENQKNNGLFLYRLMTPDYATWQKEAAFRGFSYNQFGVQN
jgi:hypothetical protein